MKNLIKFFSFAALVAIFATSCNPDPCKDVVCGTHGDCVEGTCDCRDGYEKDSSDLCNTEIRAKFFGSYSMSEDATDVQTGSTFPPVAHTVTIATASSSVSKMLVTGLGVDNANTIINADVNDAITTNFSIADGQQISVDDGSGGSVLFEVRGASGSISGNTLNLTYNLHSTTTGNLLYTCTATGTKQ